MMVEFRKAVLPWEAADLWKLDLEIFGKDAFDEELWLRLESYWIVVDGRVAGCAAFIHDVEFQEDSAFLVSPWKSPGFLGRAPSHCFLTH